MISTPNEKKWFHQCFKCGQPGSSWEEGRSGAFLDLAAFRPFKAEWILLGPDDEKARAEETAPSVNWRLTEGFFFLQLAGVG